VVESAFLTELTKPIEEQRFEPLQVALKKLEEGLAEESSARAACAMLNKRLETQQWIAEATVARDEAPPVNDSSKKPLPPRDRLQRFESIGWLRYESRFGAPGVFYLEKGGRRQHLLSCNTRRFDLALYVGFEVGVIGPRRTPLADTLSTLDVERIEVLGSEGR
jgi:hypothetical protein